MNRDTPQLTPTQQAYYKRLALRKEYVAKIADLINVTPGEDPSTISRIVGVPQAGLVHFAGNGRAVRVLVRDARGELLLVGAPPSAAILFSEQLLQDAKTEYLNRYLL